MVSPEHDVLPAQYEGAVWMGVGGSTPSNCPFPLVFFFPLAIWRNEVAVRERGGTVFTVRRGGNQGMISGLERCWSCCASASETRVCLIALF